jgi:uncharacterized phage-associated protein
MSAPHSTAAIANWFLDRAKAEGKTLDPMKLQKLIYFAHGWYLALTGNPLIDEHPQAWNYGPVIPTIYHEFKRFGRGPVTELAFDLEPMSIPAGEDWRKYLLRRKWHEPKIDDPETQEFLDQIWKVYGDMSGVQLANLSHVPDGAWDRAYKSAGGKRNVAISDDLIKAEFEAKKSRGEAA